MAISVVSRGRFKLRDVSVRPVYGAAELRRWDALMSEFHYLPFKGLFGQSLRHVAVCGGSTDSPRRSCNAVTVSGELFVSDAATSPGNQLEVGVWLWAADDHCPKPHVRRQWLRAWLSPSRREALSMVVFTSEGANPL